MLRAINNARVVAPGALNEGVTVTLEEGRIAGIRRLPERAGEALDAAGRFVLPGVVDLHSDVIEKQLVPRPGVELSPEVAFLQTDRLFASLGITTGFHALSFMEGAGRSLKRTRELYGFVAEHGHRGLVRHELHLRCELPQERSAEVVEELLSDRRAGIVSIMDHTPGQGQYKDVNWYTRYRSEDRGASEEDLDRAIARSAEGRVVPLGHAERAARVGRAAGDAVFASHDDDTAERVEMVAAEGAEISEFPVNAESARRAKELGLRVCVGAPNAVRGRSSGGNLSAAAAVRLGLVDALVSDYHPPSMLLAAFRLAKDGVVALPEAVRLVSSGPAGAAGLADRGEVREGALADLIVVGEAFGLPVVTHTVVGGKVVSCCDP